MVEGKGGAICLLFTAATINSTLFHKIYANDGAVFDVDGMISQLKVYHSNVTEIQIYNTGGIARYWQSNTIFGARVLDQYFINCTFTDFISTKRASGFYIGYETGIFDINGGGGSILLSSDQKYGQSVIKDFLLETRINEESSSLFYSNEKSFSLEMTDILIECQPLDQDDYVQDHTKTYATAIKIKRSLKGVTSKRNIFKNCQNVVDGSIFSITSTSLIDEDSEYYNNSASSGGILACTTCTVQITNSTFHDNKAESGGLFILYESYNMTLNSVQIWENYATKRGGIFFVNQIIEPSTCSDLNLTIINSTFYDIQATDDGGLLSLTKGKTFYLKDLSITRVTANYFQVVTSIALIRNFTIENCQIICDSNYQGDSSQELDQISPNSTKSGIFSFQNAYGISILKSKFQQCSSSVQGGVFKLSKVSYFYDYNSRYLMNSAIFGGVIHSSQSSVSLNETYFKDNQANRGGCIELSYDSYLFMNKVKFSNNIAFSSAGVIFVQSRSYFEIINTDFSRNKANDSSIIDSQFRGNGIQNKDLYQNRGSFLFISLDVKLSIENSSFMKGFAQYGGVLYISGDSEITISKSTFVDNQAVESGGAIYADGFSFLNITNESKLINNLGFYGDDIYISNSNGIFSLDQVTIDNPNAKGSIVVGDAQVYFQNVLMKNIGLEQKVKSQGAALACFNCLKIEIISSVFDNLHGSLGGAIYLNEVDLRKTDNVQAKNYFFKDSIFKNSVAYAGGAIYLDNINILFLDNCTFINNQAISTLDQNYKIYNGSGGAIYFDCNQYVLKCSFTIYNKNKFQGNIAHLQGGALHWTNIEPEFGENTIFENNLSYLYGNNISCFAQNISGGKIEPIYLALTDQYRQIVTADSTNKIRLVINVTNTLNHKYPPIIEGDSTFYLSYGLTEIKDVAFAGTPGESYSISFLTEAIDKTKKANIQYMNANGMDQIDFKVDINLRECEIGEQFTSSGKCVECPSGLSFSLTKMNEPGNCQLCPDQKAICYGGTFIGPKAGYWRKDNIGYSRVENKLCSKCPEPLFNILRLFAVFLLSVIIVIFLIRSTLNGARDKRNITSVYLKILMNHLQVIVLTAQFDFQWPQKILDFYNGIRPAAQSTYQVISIDCFLDIRSSYENDWIRVYFQKITILSILPLLLVIISIFSWIIYLKISRSRAEQTGRIVSTIIILLFLAHPSIVQYMFSNFRCLNIDSDQRIEDDLEVICWSDFHNFISYFIASPSILVWGIGIPFFALVLLFKHRSRLEQNGLRERYGFLYKGYKKEYYYWEIFIMYRKLIIIFISVFFKNHGVIAQALVVMIFYIFFMLLTFKLNPFINITLNQLESLSLLTSMLTIYCGLYFIANIHQDWLKNEPELKNFLILSEDEKMFFFSVILISNLLFFIHWLSKMFKELQFNLMIKLPKLYLFFCMFNDSQKFKSKLNQLRIQDESENLHDEFDRTQRQLKELYLSGKLVLNKKSVEKLQLIFNPDQVLRQLKQGGSLGNIDMLASDLKGSQVQIQEKSKLRKERKLKIAKILNETLLDKELQFNEKVQGEKELSFSSYQKGSKKVESDYIKNKFNFLSQDRANEETRFNEISYFNNTNTDDNNLLKNNFSTPKIIFQKNSIEFDTDQEESKELIINQKNSKRVGRIQTPHLGTQQNQQNSIKYQNQSQIRNQDQFENITEDDDTMRSHLNLNKLLFNKQSQNAAQMSKLNFYLLQSFENQSQIVDDALESIDSNEDIQKFKSCLIENNDEQNIVIKPKRQKTRKVKDSVNGKNSNRSIVRNLTGCDSLGTPSQRLREPNNKVQSASIVKNSMISKNEMIKINNNITQEIHTLLILDHQPSFESKTNRIQETHSDDNFNQDEMKEVSLQVSEQSLQSQDSNEDHFVENLTDYQEKLSLQDIEENQNQLYNH
ncbi:UNKNOWN [Stylonychia lemnae]|uniref:Transmembrane protein n=1 Tax=Stylonychia lemnae TaxID=5949 RepID=A0A078B615_STYLE|nr:UNKNOWN [Stylonychia lemnae]|eukprot:CDW88757.1 UNKNOWN [Stylonychia lemnae]